MRKPWSTVGRIEPCCCIPAIGRVCERCQKDENHHETAQKDESLTNLKGYGYTKADQDGFDGEKVSAVEHKAEELNDEA